jgi:hypothetical protein
MVVIGGIGFAAWWFDRDRRIKRELKRLPVTPIKDVRDGELRKVVGRLRPVGETVVAPISGRACAYYFVEVQELRGSGRSRRWVVVAREEDARDFLLEDEGGRALVRTGRDLHAHPQIRGVPLRQRLISMTVAVVKDRSYDAGIFKDPPAALEAFLARHGVSTKGWLFNRTLRCREGVLEEGEAIAAAGVGRWEPDPDPGGVGGAYREAPRRLVLEAAGNVPLFVSDDPSTTR